jgi:hypothetical protein
MGVSGIQCMQMVIFDTTLVAYLDYMFFFLNTWLVDVNQIPASQSTKHSWQGWQLVKASLSLKLAIFLWVAPNVAPFSSRNIVKATVLMSMSLSKKSLMNKLLHMYSFIDTNVLLS